jgi:hypothetical protein
VRLFYPYLCFSVFESWFVLLDLLGKDNSPSSWQYENDVSEALKTAFHTAKARKKRRKRKY